MIGFFQRLHAKMVWRREQAAHAKAIKERRKRHQAIRDLEQARRERTHEALRGRG